MEIEQIILVLKCQQPIIAHGNSLRGYISNMFPENEILHNHKKDGKLIYLYPRVQYKIIDGNALIIGIDEGVEIVKLLERKTEKIILKGEEYNIVEKQIISKNVSLGISESFSKYHFIRPWIALNEDNFDEFIRLVSNKKKEELLKKILTGNIISMSKSFGYVVEKDIDITSLKVNETNSFLKGNPMLSFVGTFEVNFNIPDLWGIGKSVSRGFGTVKRI